MHINIYSLNPIKGWSTQSLPKLFDVLFLDFSKLACNLCIEVFERTIGVLQEDIFKVQKYLLLFGFTLYVEWAKTTEDSTAYFLLNQVVVVTLRPIRSFSFLFLLIFGLLFGLDCCSVFYLNFYLMLLWGLKFSQIIHIFFFLIDHRFCLLCFDCSLGYFFFFAEWFNRSSQLGLL